METKEKVYLTVGLFVLVASIGITYHIAEGDTAYYCEAENSVGLCFKLSKVNDAGLQTRCYYNQETPTKYNYCKSGWFPYEDPTVTGELIKVDDNLRIEKVGDKYIFWKKEKVETKEALMEEINKMLSDLNRLSADKEYWTNEYYGLCIGSCPFDCEIEISYQEGTNKNECIAFCPMKCETDRHFQLMFLDSEITKLNEEKDLIQTAIK